MQRGTLAPMTRERSSSSPGREDFTNSAPAAARKRRPCARGTTSPSESQTFLRAGAPNAEDDAGRSGRVCEGSRSAERAATLDAVTRNGPEAGPMSPAMAVKKPKHRSTGNTPTNPRLATGEVIIVGGDTARRAALKAAGRPRIGPRGEGSRRPGAAEALHSSALDRASREAPGPRVPARLGARQAARRPARRAAEVVGRGVSAHARGDLHRRT